MTMTMMIIVFGASSYPREAWGQISSLHCWVSTWMGNHLWAGKSSRYVTGHLGQFSLPSLQNKPIEYQPVWLWLRRGVLTCVVWQVTLCDPTWQVTSRNCEMWFGSINSYCIHYWHYVSWLSCTVNFESPCMWLT